MYLLDTNVLSELRKLGDGKADSNVVAWFAQRDAALFYVSAISLMEIELGVLLIERRDPAQGGRLRQWMDHYVLPEFAERTVSVDTTIALRCAALHVPDPRSSRDALIAASALVHGMSVVTRNARDFEPTGVGVINPWDAEAAK